MDGAIDAARGDAVAQAVLQGDDGVGLVHHRRGETIAERIAAEGQCRPAHGRETRRRGVRARQRKVTRASRSSICGMADGSSNSISASTKWALPTPRSALLRLRRVTVIGARTILPP